MKSQNSNLDSMLKYNHLITPVLMDVVDTIPPEIWITKISYTDQFPGKGGDARQLTIEGFIKSGKDGRADLALGNKFKDSLVQKPNLKPFCGTTGNITYANVAGTGTGGSSSNRSAAGKETSYVFTCGKGGTR